MNDLISIIIPVYNAGKYLQECIEKTINQTYKNIEIFLINDGSTDNSGEICSRYENKDKRIKSIHTQNQGVSSARNLAIQKSGGEFIFFLDADDFIEDDAINTLMKRYRESNADFIIGNFRKMKNGFEEKRTDTQILEDKLFSEENVLENARSYLRRPNKNLLFAFSWARLFKTSIIKEKNINFNNKLQNFEDVAFNFDYLKNVKNLYFTKDVIYNHRVYDNFSSETFNIGKNPKRLFGYLEALTSAENFLKGRIGEEKAKKEIGHCRTYLSIIQLVRTCGQINSSNKESIYDMIKELVNDEKVKEGIRYYLPSKGDSKIIPMLMQFGLVNPIIEICKYKSYKRYKGSKKK